MITNRKQRLITAIQWGLTIAAVWYVAHGVSWRKIFMLLSDIDIRILLVVALITLIQFGTQFSQWWILLNALTPTPLSTVIRIDLVIKFINHIIPSKVSGHSIAPLVVKQYTAIAWSDAVTVSGVKTGLYATCYGFTAFFGLMILHTRLPSGLTVVTLLSSAMYAVVGLLILLAGRRLESANILFHRIEQLLSRIPRFGSRLAGIVGKLPSFTQESAALFRELSASSGVVVPYTLAWVGSLLVFPGIRVALLLTGLGGSFTPLWLLPIILVVAYSVTVLPLTPGGVGIAEASATLVLVSLGVVEEIAVAVVLIDRVFSVYLPALIGSVPVANINLKALLSSEQ